MISGSFTSYFDGLIKYSQQLKRKKHIDVQALKTKGNLVMLLIFITDRSQTSYPRKKHPYQAAGFVRNRE
jgi:hypothetical protein